jgi:hypothetical protein
MEWEEYTALGFELIKLDLNSIVLKFNNKIIYIYFSNSEIDDQFLKRICDTCLEASKKRTMDTLPQ